jgi:hypothetical protein
MTQFKTRGLFESNLVHDASFKKELINFCKTAYHNKKDPAHVNMWHPDWENNSETLLFNIFVSKRLCGATGETFLLWRDDLLIAVSSVYVSSFDSNVAIGGVRSWVVGKYRGDLMIGRYLLPLQYQWAKKRNLKTFMLTFNDYNKKLINIIKRSGFGRVKNRTEEKPFFYGVHTIDFPVTIQHTKQWIVYDKIDKNYEPNWKKIEHRCI